MEEELVIVGKIGFEPINYTRKHESQASWKRIAMLFFDGDVSDYYAWFINKRYNLILNKPLRGAHISFINDKVSDIMVDGKYIENEANLIWDATKKKWDGKEIPILLDLSPRTNGKHWWLRVHNDAHHVFDNIRAEVNLGKIKFPYHMSIGYANERNIEHSQYILSLVRSGLIK